MSLSEKQRKFTKYVGLLISWAYENGYELTVGEAFRTPEQQQMHLISGKSKVKHSLHQDRLAIDFNLFVDGQYRIDKNSYMAMGIFWKSLDKDNIWGGDWGWDANHFQYTK